MNGTSNRLLLELTNARISLANPAAKAVEPIEAPHYERSDRLDSAAGYLYEALGLPGEFKDFQSVLPG